MPTSARSSCLSNPRGRPMVQRRCMGRRRVAPGFPALLPFVSTNGESGTWSLNTAGMDSCGYVVRIDVSDRTIVSADGGWTNAASVGFCLKAPE